MKTSMLILGLLLTTGAHAAPTRTLDGQQITNGAAVLTLPTSTDTIVGRATTDTLTGKTLSGAANTFSLIPLSAIGNGAAISGSNTGDVTIGTANGLSLAGQALSLQAASATQPGALLAADFATFAAKQAAGNYLTALTGDVTAAGPGSATATLATVATAGSFSNANITIDAKGRVTSASNGAAQGATIVGTRTAPTAITAAAGVAYTAAASTDAYIQGSGGPVTVTASPQVAAGTTDGQRLTLIGRSGTNTVTLADGAGLSLNGAWVAGLDSILHLRWDGAAWVEVSRR